MNYDRYYTCDVLNGEGLRVVLFVSGCVHACGGCHNKALWNRKAGKEFTQEVLDEILKACASHDGLTLSGGDPLHPANWGAVEDICRQFKAMYPEKDIWLWTGYSYEAVQHLPLMRYLDVVVDGLYVQGLPTTKPWRGSDNQRLIRIKEIGASAVEVAKAA
jgi:anaerobic ribonucleoside-triphosphate reductase activating protein